MKKSYNTPEIEINVYNANDVITTSVAEELKEIYDVKVDPYGQDRNDW